MRLTPPDPAFNRAIRNILLDSFQRPQVMFISNHNEVMVTLADGQITHDNVEHQRARLEAAGVLKAIVWVANYRSGDKGTISTIEFLPDGHYYSFGVQPQTYQWLEFGVDQPKEGGNKRRPKNNNN